jgi:hypothetical protein
MDGTSSHYRPLIGAQIRSAGWSSRDRANLKLRNMPCKVYTSRRFYVMTVQRVILSRCQRLRVMLQEEVP